ncbi:hypothetical protein Tco_0324094 [Tanacetum coccineum]
MKRPILPHSTRSAVEPARNVFKTINMKDARRRRIKHQQHYDEDDTDTEEEAKEEEAIGKQEVAPPVSNQVEATT